MNKSQFYVRLAYTVGAVGRSGSNSASSFSPRSRRHCRGLNNVINPNDARRLRIKGQATEVLNYSVNYCHYRDLSAKAYLTFGADPIEELTKLAEQIYSEFPHSIFFTSSSFLNVTIGIFATASRSPASL
jgi:hypothetical protein